MPERGKAAVIAGSQCQILYICGAIAEREHLLPGEVHPDRALERARSQRGKGQLILRPQARPECAADKR